MPPPFLGPGEARALSRSLALVGSDDTVWGTLVATGGATPRTVWHRRSGAGQWTPLLSALQHAADSAGFARGVQAPRRGRVGVYPLTSGLAYVQSFYDWPSERPPRLSGVAVAIVPATRTGGAVTPPLLVRTGRTLAEALGVAEQERVAGAAAWRSRVAALYDAMDRALKRGDWSAFGEAFTTLGEIAPRRSLIERRSGSFQGCRFPDLHPVFSMNLHEYQGKELFARYGLPVPAGQVAGTPEEAREIAAQIGGLVVIKAQVQVGGRGKAGGVKLAQTPEEAYEKARDILALDDQGLAGAPRAGGAGGGHRPGVLLSASSWTARRRRRSSCSRPRAAWTSRRWRAPRPTRSSASTSR